VTLRYTVAAGCLLVGLLLVVQGLVVSPQVTSVECTSSSSANATGPSPTPDCVRTTEPATGQRLYIIGLGASIACFGVAVVALDRRFVRRSRRAR
jgi:hypothetical protein